jgi:hypothetical protein
MVGSDLAHKGFWVASREVGLLRGSVTSSGVNGPDAANQWKRPERSCAAIRAAQVRASRWTFAEQQPLAVELHQIELFTARRDGHDPEASC